MTLDAEIKWWTKRAFANESEAALIAFGVATGLKLARADYGAGVMTTKIYCDRCNADGAIAVKISVHTAAGTVEGLQTHNADLCGECFTKFREGVVALTSKDRKP